MNKVNLYSMFLGHQIFLNPKTLERKELYENDILTAEFSPTIQNFSMFLHT